MALEASDSVKSWPNQTTGASHDEQKARSSKPSPQTESPEDAKLRHELNETVKLLQKLEKQAAKADETHEIKKFQLMETERIMEHENNIKLEELKVQEKHLLEPNTTSNTEDPQAVVSKLRTIRSAEGKVCSELERTNKEFFRKFSEMKEKYDEEKHQRMKAIEELRKKKISIEKQLNICSNGSKTSFGQELHRDAVASESAEESNKHHDWKSHRRAIVEQIHRIPSATNVHCDASLERIGDYKISTELVKHTYIGICYKARNNKRNVDCIAKIIDLREISPYYLKHFRENTFRVLWFLRTTAAKNICEILDDFIVNDTRFVIMEEYLKLSFELMVEQLGARKEDEIRRYAKGLCNAVYFLHNAGIAHQNLSAHNIYLSAEKVVKVAALEYAIIYIDAEKNVLKLQQFRQKVRPGRFVAPEISDGKTYDPTKVDMYSLGVLVYYLALGRYPSDGALKMPIDEQWNQSREEFNTIMSGPAKDFTDKCLHAVPDNRMDVRMAIDHPWLSSL